MMSGPPAQQCTTTHSGLYRDQREGQSGLRIRMNKEGRWKKMGVNGYIKKLRSKYFVGASQQQTS